MIETIRNISIQPATGISGTNSNYISHFNYPITSSSSYISPITSLPRWSQRTSLSTTISCLYAYIVRTCYETDGILMTIISSKENVLETNLSSRLTGEFSNSELRKILQYFISIYEEISEAANKPYFIDIKFDTEDVPTFLRKQTILNKLNNIEKEANEVSWHAFDIKAHNDLFIKLDNIMSISNYLISDQESSINIGIGLLKTLM